MDFIYDSAISFLLDKMDIDVTAWIIGKDRIEYGKLYMKANGECPYCGNPEKMYWCKKCESNCESEKCIDCGSKTKLDEGYHRHC